MTVSPFPVALCLYCGKAPHVTPLACPRIAEITIDVEGNLCGLIFWEDFFNESPATAKNPDDAA